ncbi:PrsW family glutamic-type intramembrane protease [Actinoplanes sp. NPDC051513]|uniref:PrsW family intramembrane metalloprotease n=1 Tax=Actinoplanes sp. NPDC051513 TaxID=3363908 RepID=UPI003795868A
MADVSPGGPPDQSAPTQAVPHPSALPTQAFASDPSVGALPAGAAFEQPPGPDAVYAGAVPAGPVPAGSVPAGSLQAGSLQAGSLQAGALQAGGLPAAYLPADAAVPTQSIGRTMGWRRWLPMVGVVGFLLAGAVGMLFFLGVDIGLTGLTVGLIAAVLPVPLLVASFLWLDRYEPEPIRYLAFCFTWGAAIATAAALLVNTEASKLFDRWGFPDALVAVLVAPFIEESMKALGPVLLLWRRRSEWSGITDGIVYCGMSALGFAMVENVLYLGKHGYATGAQEYGPATGLQNLFLIFIVRILFTGFAHPLFTSMTGIGLGISARSGDRRVRWLAPIAGLLLAMILHGTFNLLPTLSASLEKPFIMLYGYLGFMVPLFFAVVGFAIALRAWEGRLTERVLPLYVRAGWFSPPEVASLGSLGRRHSARQWAKRVAGVSGQRAMREFQFAATHLALLRDGMQRGLHTTPTDQYRTTSEEHRLLQEIQTYRQSFTAKDPTTPQSFWDGLNYHIVFPDGVPRILPPPADPVVPVPIRLPPPPPAYAMPGYGPPAYGGPGYGAPGYGGPGYGSPGQGAPGYGGPGYGAPGYGAPGYGAPSQGAPGYGAPGYGAPGYGSPNQGAPGYGAPGYGAPSQGAPGYGASGYGASGYGSPGQGAPGYGSGNVPNPYVRPATPDYGNSATPGYDGPPPFAPGPASGPPTPAAGYAEPSTQPVEPPRPYVSSSESEPPTRPDAARPE